jgi:hypothetical protein
VPRHEPQSAREMAAPPSPRRKRASHKAATRATHLLATWPPSPDTLTRANTGSRHIGMGADGRARSGTVAHRRISKTQRRVIRGTANLTHSTKGNDTVICAYLHRKTKKSTNRSSTAGNTGRERVNPLAQRPRRAPLADHRLWQLAFMLLTSKDAWVMTWSNGMARRLRCSDALRLIGNPKTKISAYIPASMRRTPCLISES